ncbi:hypothetical protein AHAS_Ahas10G0082400 [Arachis hypogaea]
MTNRTSISTDTSNNDTGENTRGPEAEAGPSSRMTNPVITEGVLLTVPNTWPPYGLPPNYSPPLKNPNMGYIHIYEVQPQKEQPLV